MTAHPYKTQAPTAFWSRSVSDNWDAARLIADVAPILRAGDKIATLGSCFAANLVPYLRAGGFEYVQEEKRHSAFAAEPADNLSYDKFSAAYGNIYTVRQFRQLLGRCAGAWRPQEDRWNDGTVVIDPFRPGLRYPARTNAEFDALTAQHLRAVKRVFFKADVVIFTLGLTEAWMSKLDGAVFPACPGTIAGQFDPEKHVFKNFTVAEIVDDLTEIYRELKVLNTDVRLILTVSPVPLVATAGHDHVLVASSYSKSVLRAACGEITAAFPGILYFPSYEIITGPQAPDDFFEPDKRNVSRKGVDEVMRAFLQNCETSDIGTRSRTAETNVEDKTAQLSQSLMDIECEEAGAAL